jgi:hypothetical protein
MELQDPPIGFIGVWNTLRSIENNRINFDLFYIWDVQDGTYWSYDKIGVAHIKFDELSDEKIIFRKSYISQGDGEINELTYSGERKENGVYRGQWNGGGDNGVFVLAKIPGGNFSEVEKRFGQLARKVLDDHIKEKRDKFEDSPLWVALQK